MLGQNKLEKIFHSALAEYECSVELGTELQSFEQTSSSVKVKLIKRGFSQDPHSGELEESIFDWMIVADGVRGVVRKQLGLAFLGETRNAENFIVGDSYVEGLSQEVRPKDLWGCFSKCLIRVIFPVLAYVGRCFGISHRATETPGLFNFVVGGKNINRPMLSNNQDLLQKCFAENIGQRPDLTLPG